MSGRGSVRTLLLRVLILAALLLGLSRWTGRGARPGAAREAGSTPPVASVQDPGTEQMSAPGDLTFYKTLGSGGPVAAGGLSAPPGLTAFAGAPGTEGGAPLKGAAPASAPASHNDTRRRTQGAGPVRSAAYIIQVLATRDAGAGRRLRDHLVSRGFPAVLLEDRTGRQVVYRVRAGRYLTREEADAAARVLRRRHLSPWVLQEGL